LPHVAVFQAFGVCHDCRCITHFFARIKENRDGQMKLEWINDRGEWVQVDFLSKTWVEKFIAFIKKVVCTIKRG